MHVLIGAVCNLWRGTLISLGLLVFGCGASENYSGDGKLIDNGMFAATDRYVVELGPVALKSAGSRTYSMQNLPETPFLVGIEVVPSSSSFQLLEKKPIKSTLAISLMDGKGKQIFSHVGELASWTWNIPSTGEYAFVYVQGSEGSRFTPEVRASYQLKVEILKPDSTDLKYEATLKLKSGGWK